MTDTKVRAGVRRTWMRFLRRRDTLSIIAASQKVTERTCIHTGDSGKVCGRQVLEGAANGWLCFLHDTEAFPTASKKVALVKIGALMRGEGREVA